MQCSAMQLYDIPNAGLYIMRDPLTQEKQKLQHRFDVVGHGKGRLGLGLDFFHRDALRKLDQRQAVGEVDVEDTLLLS